MSKEMLMISIYCNMIPIYYILATKEENWQSSQRNLWEKTLG